jgi:hypothetical protein
VCPGPACRGGASESISGRDARVAAAASDGRHPRGAEPGAPDAERRYLVPAGLDEVLLDVGSLNDMAPMAQLLVACALPAHAVLETFRTGKRSPVRRVRRQSSRGAGAPQPAAVRQRPRDRLVFLRCRRSTTASMAIPRAISSRARPMLGSNQRPPRRRDRTNSRSEVS